MIQDIYPHVFRNEFVAGVAPAPESPAIHFLKGAPLIRIQDDKVQLPRVADYPKGCTFVRIFSIDDESYFLCLEDEVEPPEGFMHASIRSIRRQTLEPRHILFALYTAFQLDGWYRENRFCGRCGHPTELAKDERAIDCPGCSRRIYPKVQPAVIIGVTNGNKLLITQYSNRPHVHHALVAGFNEIGETLEETVMREVREETGLEVDNIRYYKSQPWGVASDVLAGFYCDVVGDDSVHIDPTELKEAIWYEREDIEGQSDDFSLTNEMMITFRDGNEPK